MFAIATAFRRHRLNALHLFAASSLILALPATAGDGNKAQIGIEKVEVHGPNNRHHQKIRVEPDRPHHYPLDVEIWTDKGEGAAYCDGERIEIFFRATHDSYIAIYDTDTRGRTQRLFPNRWDRDNFVEGGRTYRLPARGYDFRVEGPRGIETLTAVAALDRRDLRRGDWAPANHRYDRYDRYDRYKSVSESKDKRYGYEDGRSYDERRAYPRSYRNGSEKIAVVPRDVAVDSTEHRVRDGYRCERRRARPRPWWK